jgi:hypothetical protein
MKIFKYMKDGGPESKVAGYWLVEIKSLLSIVLLHFSDGSREAYHSHAFDAVSWVLKGFLCEAIFRGRMNFYRPSLKPIYTPRDCFHKVLSRGDTWVLSFRGPWSQTWKEFLPEQNKHITLTHGRKVVAERS